jgi:hypothetical protein
MARTRVRWTRVWLLASLLVASAWGAGRAFGGTEREPVPSRAVHLVRPGDTLWEIARARVGPEGDPRPVVEAIRELNGLTTSALIEGQALRLP